MSGVSENNFLAAVTPLFKRRVRLRLTSALLAIAMVIAGLVFPFFGYVVGIIWFVATIRLTNLELNLQAKVWELFSYNLKTIAYDTFNKVDTIPTIGGVLSRYGNGTIVTPLVQGSFDGYTLRLSKVQAFTNPRIKLAYGRSYRVLEIVAKHSYYPVFLDSKSNNELLSSSAMNILSRSLRHNKKVSVEGNVNRFFTIWAPQRSKFKSLVTLSPDKLLALREYGKGFDVEFSNNRIYIITPNRLRNPKDLYIYQTSLLSLIEKIGYNFERAPGDSLLSDQLDVSPP